MSFLKVIWDRMVYLLGNSHLVREENCTSELEFSFWSANYTKNTR